MEVHRSSRTARAATTRPAAERCLCPGTCRRTRLDLNPVESLWTNLKRQELANLATDGLGEVMVAAHRGIQRIRSAWWVPYAFARRCGLQFW
jgi:hypothetical protein